MQGQEAEIRYTIPISQSTQETELLLGGRSEEIRVGNEAEASSQLVWDVDWDCTQKSSLALSYGHLSSFSSRLTSSSNRFPQLQP